MATMYNEYEKVESMIHDTKHKALNVYEEIQNSHYESVKNLFDNWIEELTSLLHMPLCNNAVVDLILTSKMEQYKELEFKLKLNTKKEIPIDIKEFSSLLLLVVDMSCNSLVINNRNSYTFRLFIDDNTLSIFSEYAGDKDTNEVHLLEQFMMKYNGDLYIDEGIHLLIVYS